MFCSDDEINFIVDDGSMAIRVESSTVKFLSCKTIDASAGKCVGRPVEIFSYNALILDDKRDSFRATVFLCRTPFVVAR